MAKDFKDYQYGKNFLTNVICRLDFPDNIDVIGQQLDRFKHGVKEAFPVFETIPLLLFHTRFGNGEKVDTKIEIPQYQFKNTDSDKIVVLGHNHITVEFSKYKDLQEFNSCIQEIINVFTSIYTFDYSRFGVRYINQIVLEKGNPLVWKDLIDSSLTHVIDKFFERDPGLSRAMSQIVLNRGEYKINFNYGMFNSDFPAKISRKEFVLDYDCFTEYVEADKIMANLGKFNNEIKIMFENSIGGGLRKMMGVING